MKVFRPSDMGLGVEIVATGHALGAHRVTNAQLIAQGCPLTSAQIERLCGVTARHIASASQSTSDMAAAAYRAAQRELDALTSDSTVPELDNLLLATSSPDHLIPSTASIVHRMLGHAPHPAHDISAACSGFLFGLYDAARGICCGDRRAAVIASEIRSRFVDPEDRATSALFGDGAGAAILAPCAPEEGILAIGVSTMGSENHSVYIPAGGARERLDHEALAARKQYLHMEDGPGVYMNAVEGMAQVATTLLEQSNHTLDAIDWIIPHQANARIIKRMTWLLGADEERVISYVATLGNTSSASTIIALDMALREGRICAGDRVLMLAAGAGYTAGGAIIIAGESLTRQRQEGR